MSFKNFRIGLMAVAVGDTDLNAWAADNFNDATFSQLKGFREIDTIEQELLPVQLFYPASGEVKKETLGSHATRHTPEMILEIVWIEHDPDAAYEQAEALIDLVTRAIDRKATLNDMVAACQVEEWRAGDPREHPVQVMGFKVTAEYDLLTA